MSQIVALAQFWLAPCLTLVVSVIYFRASPPDQRLVERLAVSAHGCIISLLYLSAMAIWLLGASRGGFVKPFLITLIVPMVFIVASFKLFRGNAAIHWLQLINLGGLFWTFFVGGMAITGDWL